MALMPEQQGQQQRGPRETSRLGLPDGFKVYSPFPFSGVNQQAVRTAIGDREFYWSENFIRIGDGNLRTVLDSGTPIYTTPPGNQIISFFFFNLGIETDLLAIFLSGGTAVQLDLDTMVQTSITTTPGTFWQTGAPLPACVQWGTQYLLIANNFTANGYWVWDGSLLYAAGTLSPVVDLTSGGSGYTSVPAVAAVGGSGSGAVVTATVNNGSVTAVTVTNAGTGYVAGDIVQLLFAGGGSDSSAYLQAVITPGGVLGNVTLTALGSGYTDGTYALGISGGGGSGASGTYTVAGGVVVSTAVTDGGSGFTSTPTISFPSGGGTRAAAVATLLPGGTVTAVNVSIINPQGGSGYVGTPILTFVGGGGTGAAAEATVTNGVVTGVTVTAGGSGYDTPPTVIITPGANNAAAGTVTIMPIGISGGIIETFQSHVWLGVPFQSGPTSNGGTILVSAPESFVDFGTSDGGLIFVNSDPFLRASYVNLKQTNGYLYPMGDSSVSIISNVQTSGNPATTTFNYQNTDPQIGAGWRDSVQAFGRSLIFANHDGVYGLYGGAVTKLSEKLNMVFDSAILPLNASNMPVAGALVPSSAVCFIHETKLYLLLMTITDPFTGQPRRVLVAWDGREWFILSQSTVLNYIATQEVASNLLAYGTDGTNIFQLFAQPSQTLTKIVSTKLYGAPDLFITKMAYSFYTQITDYSSPPAGVTLAVTVDNEEASYPLPNEPTALSAAAPTAPVYGARSGDIPGQMLGCTVRSTSPDFVVAQLVLGYYDQVALA